MSRNYRCTHYENFCIIIFTTHCRQTKGRQSVATTFAGYVRTSRSCRDDWILRTFGLSYRMFLWRYFWNISPDRESYKIYHWGLNAPRADFKCKSTYGINIGSPLQINKRCTFLESIRASIEYVFIGKASGQLHELLDILRICSIIIFFDTIVFC